MSLFTVFIIFKPDSFDPPKLDSDFLNSEDTYVGVINKENAEGGINIRIES